MVKRTVVNTIYQDLPQWLYDNRKQAFLSDGFDLEYRVRGEDVPRVAHTMYVGGMVVTCPRQAMLVPDGCTSPSRFSAALRCVVMLSLHRVGFQRLSNVQQLVTDCIKRGVPGDVIETGVYRGGTTIFMKAILRAYGEEDRRVWVCDTFQPQPPPPGFLGHMLALPVRCCRSPLCSALPLAALPVVVVVVVVVSRLIHHFSSHLTLAFGWFVRMRAVDALVFQHPRWSVASLLV